MEMPRAGARGRRDGPVRLRAAAAFDLELEDVRSAVVSAHVEGEGFAGDGAQIAIGDDEGLFAEHRAREVRAVRADDGAAAGDEQTIGFSTRLWEFRSRGARILRTGARIPSRSRPRRTQRRG